ncbi:aromatic acid exporter family protein [Heyndrickxia ginsengihumi]|uniref:aromatic acid exporter family protein n=1 Tax=Heyndrickxia ginsengihumi TaxID=363870 RepID=UPI00203E87A0|nr:aromatic acid exporter family protein [Heyndrickxia ginsengihumi]MCM3022833.1 aromatic acid exporter family protein [Heyndrickxia ginsengihumi]
MFRIGYRTLKTAVATPIAISIAQFFHLHNFLSAGIIAILCIQNTKKKSLSAAWSRFVACMLNMMISSILFTVFGYHSFVIGLVLFLFIPITVMLKVNEGIVTSSVILLHFYANGHVTWSFLFNEFLIIMIGIGAALIMNLYMPSLDQTLINYQQQIEANFRIIFEEMIQYLRMDKMTWEGKEITETASLLEEGRKLAFRDVENRITTRDSFYYEYFKMREQQFEIIERCLPTLTSISTMVSQRNLVADFIEEVKNNIKPENTAQNRLDSLYRLQEEMKTMALPKDREEFEARAALYHFLQEMEQYLLIKSEFKDTVNGNKNEEQTSRKRETR